MRSLIGLQEKREGSMNEESILMLPSIVSSVLRDTDRRQHEYYSTRNDPTYDGSHT